MLSAAFPWGSICYADGSGRLHARRSAAKEALVSGLDADAFIDYQGQPFDRLVDDMDVVFDLVGKATFDRAFQTLKTGGFLVTAVAFSQDEVSRYGVGVASVFCKKNAEQLVSIRKLAEAGTRKAHVTKVLPLASIREALDLSERGLTLGKIVLAVMGES